MIKSLRIQATRANFLGLRTASTTGIGQRVRVPRAERKGANPQHSASHAWPVARPGMKR